MTAVPGLQTKGSMPWHALMVALSVTKTNVKEILSDNERCDHSLPYSAFDMSRKQAGHLRESFRFLKKLQLTLTEYEYGSLRSSRGSCAAGSVAKAFSGANDLEQLEISTGYNDESPAHEDFGAQFRGFLKGCTFPKLQSLISSCIESTEDELIDFLTASSTIEKLELCSYDLNWGSWEHLVERIKALLRLKTVSIPEACGGLPEPFFHVDYWSDKDIVEAYFFHNGANSFTKGALE